MADNPADDGSKDRVLRKSVLIGDLSEASLNKIAKLGRPKRLEARETLFAQEDPSDAFYVMLAGAVEISILATNGKKLSLNVMRPSDVFGEIGALDGDVRTAAADGRRPAIDPPQQPARR